MPFFAFLFLTLYLCVINDQLFCRQTLSRFVVYNRSCSVPPAVPVQFYELGGAGTLFANNHRCRKAVPLRPKAFELKVPWNAIRGAVLGQNTKIFGGGA